MTTNDQDQQNNKQSKYANWGKSFVILLVILIAAFLLVLFGAAPGDKPSLDNMAVISIVTVVAIAIERLMESFWTWIGLTKGTFWPLCVMCELDKSVKDLDEKLKIIYDQADDLLQKLIDDKKIADDAAKKVKGMIDEARVKNAWLKEQAPGHQKVKALTTSAKDTVKYLDKVLDGFSEISKGSEAYIDGVSNFVATFKDNPARRLLSIVLGAILGLAVAGVMRLDIVSAAGDVKLYQGLGVALTGLLMGLGATPTHEVIRSLQEYKKSRKQGNA